MEIPSAFDIFSIFTNETFLSPLSTPPIYVRSNPDL